MPEKLQEEKLRQEILDDARLKAERIVARAKNEAQRNLEAARREVEEKRQERIQEANGDADAKCHSIMLDVQREETRHWLQQRESCIEAMFQQALERAVQTQGTARAESLKQLAEEALAAIGPAPMRVLFNARDAAIVTDSWLASLARRVFGAQADQVSFQLEPGENTPDGIMLVTANGVRTFDNTYANRLNTLKNTLRIALAPQGQVHPGQG